MICCLVARKLNFECLCSRQKDFSCTICVILVFQPIFLVFISFFPHYLFWVLSFLYFLVSCNPGHCLFTCEISACSTFLAMFATRIYQKSFFSCFASTFLSTCPVFALSLSSWFLLLFTALCILFSATELFTDLEGAFQSKIDAAYFETSKYLLDVLNKNYQLLEHLQAMRRYLLLGQGDFIRHLMDLLK